MTQTTSTQPALDALTAAATSYDPCCATLDEQLIELAAAARAAGASWERIGNALGYDDPDLAPGVAGEIAYTAVALGADITELVEATELY